MNRNITHNICPILTKCMNYLMEIRRIFIRRIPFIRNMQRAHEAWSDIVDDGDGGGEWHVWRVFWIWLFWCAVRERSPSWCSYIPSFSIAAQRYYIYCIIPLIIISLGREFEKKSIFPVDGAALFGVCYSGVSSPYYNFTCSYALKLMFLIFIIIIWQVSPNNFPFKR